MDEIRDAALPIQEQLANVRSGRLSRRGFLAGITGMGVTTAGALTMLVAKSNSASAVHAQQQKHFDLHDQHVAQQVSGDIEGHVADYADNAVVEDPLFSEPFVGRAAIAHRFAAEVASVPDRSLQITNRALVGNQLVVEWIASGTHQNDFLGFGGTGKHYTMSGVTIITRQDGKIIRESHYYSVAHLRRQIEF